MRKRLLPPSTSLFQKKYQILSFEKLLKEPCRLLYLCVRTSKHKSNQIMLRRVEFQVCSAYIFLSFLNVHFSSPQNHSGFSQSDLSSHSSQSPRSTLAPTKCVNLSTTTFTSGRATDGTQGHKVRSRRALEQSR